MASTMADVAAEVQRSLLKSCWYVSCGGSVGTTFQLVLGEKILRSVPVANPAHSDDFRHFEGEANLLVWCTWRLDSADAPLTSSDDAVEHVEKVLERLVGQTVVDVRVDLPGWDLHLDFTEGARLHIFCDHVPGDPSFDGNWDLFLADKLISIGVGSRCDVEQRLP
jgi:hypothetical protein